MQRYLYMGLFIAVQIWTILIHDGDMIAGHWTDKFIKQPRAPHVAPHVLYRQIWTILHLGWQLFRLAQSTGASTGSSPWCPQGDASKRAHGWAGQPDQKAKKGVKCFRFPGGIKVYGKHAYSDWTRQGRLFVPSQLISLSWIQYLHQQFESSITVIPFRIGHLSQMTRTYYRRMLAIFKQTGSLVICLAMCIFFWEAVVTSQTTSACVDRFREWYW